jgi:hypothetical protein
MVADPNRDDGDPDGTARAGHMTWSPSRTNERLRGAAEIGR